MPQNKSCHVVKQGDRVLGKYFNDLSCLQKFFAKVAVTFFGFVTVLSTCCCARQVKEDDRVFQLFVLPPNYFDKVAVTFFDYAKVLSPCCIGQSCLQISLQKWLSPYLTM
jgi:hypothetical protein